MALNTKKVIDQLNRILECELAGVVRYTHYSMMIFGYSRIPIVKWFQDEAVESLGHAQQAGEMITRLGGHPSLDEGPAHGRRLTLQLDQLVRIFRGKRIGDRGEQLRHFHDRAFQPAERGCEQQPADDFPFPRSAHDCGCAPPPGRRNSPRSRATEKRFRREGVG